METKYDRMPYAKVRLLARRLVGHLRVNNSRFRDQNAREAAELIEHLLARQEYLSMAEMVGSEMLAAERARRRGGWLRGWRVYQKTLGGIEQGLRRVDFMEGKR